MQPWALWLGRAALSVCEHPEAHTQQSSRHACPGWVVHIHARALGAIGVITELSPTRIQCVFKADESLIGGVRDVKCCLGHGGMICRCSGRRDPGGWECVLLDGCILNTETPLRA